MDKTTQHEVEIDRHLRNSGNWHSPDPRRCDCRGTGWNLTDRDVFYRCSIHAYPDQPHPEDTPDFDGDREEQDHYESQESLSRAFHFRGLYRDVLVLIRKEGGSPQSLYDHIVSEGLKGCPIACLSAAYEYLDELSELS